LIGKPPEKLSRAIDKLAFPEAMCALRLSQTGEPGQRRLREETAELLRRLLPGTQLSFYENGIAALLPAEGASGLSEAQCAALAQLAREEGLAVGVSGAFGSVEDFAARYAQALRALSLAARVGGTEPVFLYTELAFYDLLAAAGKSGELQQFCHPALERLRRYDAENGAELLRTLEAYLTCNCSVKLAAERLFIHRNSLAYRLHRILELTGLDLSDPGTRFLLEMSFAIVRFGEGG
jgi:DNA-binding PucR family transcriptional regulator